METRVEKKGKSFDVIILAGGESKTATFKTEQEAIDYKTFMEGLRDRLKSKPKKTTRMSATIQAFKTMNESGFTMDEITEKADQIFSEDGGKSNVKNQSWDVKHFMRILGDLGTGYVVPEINLKKE